jgi:hypothetical protein
VDWNNDGHPIVHDDSPLEMISSCLDLRSSGRSSDFVGGLWSCYEENTTLDRQAAQWQFGIWIWWLSAE